MEGLAGTHRVAKMQCRSVSRRQLLLRQRGQARPGKQLGDGLGRFRSTSARYPHRARLLADALAVLGRGKLLEGHDQFFLTVDERGRGAWNLKRLFGVTRLSSSLTPTLTSAPGIT